MASILFFAVIGSLALGWLGFALGKAIFRPVAKKKAVRFRVKQEKKKDWDPDSVFQLLKLDLKEVFLSETAEQELNAKLRRLGLAKSARDVRKEQIVLSGVSLLVGLFSYWAFAPVLGLLGLAIAAAGWIYPVETINREIRQMNEIVYKKFPSFYRRNYYSYKKNINTSLSRVVESHMRVCHPAFQRELKVFLEDIESVGEFEAIQRWKNRLPLPYIIRYAEIIESRLRGEDNTPVMENFKLELDKMREVQVDKDLLKLESRINGVLGLMYVPFFLLLIIYFLAQMQGSGLVQFFKQLQ
ncbi:hypothetical protein PM3016_357 [Paenibacillus mucilaginosus 3016]|uniref:Flp pilus assembly protein TadB n=2 Tax=Paenibacillus mucilaginosus TaxID=61624 RepID=H6NRQ1_9BACL|nr:hypothetical protein [Paenibacillus mucilaginosus]AFC27333.1 hypothetical protein PM3016_357 [Paenibacillus mucilaginosus 3016]AFH59477.1 hypothetical protein B2K_01830 [Paenibacillus mucilaginosus K02]WFA16245.1 hypothetical protein ERY13_01945 [Paenibacillus mucilaginosus]